MKFKTILSTLSKRPPPLPPAPELKPEHRLCVVGDVHGRIDLLNSMLAQIDQKARQNGGIDKLVFLGDYIDRGEASADVLRRLHSFSHDWPENVVCLKGNHEQMLLNFLDDPRKAGRSWLRNGGLQTLASFGVGNVTETSEAEALETARDSLREQLPEDIEVWLRSLSLTFQSGNICAVHAALDPSQSLADQTERTLLWGSRLFRKEMRDDGLWVIHGHTIVDEPTVNDGVISIDTGAYASNLLSAALIDSSGEIEFI